MRHDQSTGIWLFAVPPTARQTQIVATLAIALLVSVGVCAPFANIPLPKIDSFIPTVEGAIILTYLITAIMLLSQVSICRSYALLALACGYLFTALITVSHLLTFPGAFSPTGLLGAGAQSAAWLFIFWHFGLAAATVIYALLEPEEPEDSPATASSISYAIGWSIAIVVGAVCGLTILATLTDQVLPSLFLDPIRAAPLAYYALGFDGVVCASAIAMLWSQRR
jgi:Membrane-associated sensor, integral membrane domain